MTSTIERPTGRRVTPTGTLVLPSTASRDEWLDARRHGITATDIVKIVGASQYGSAVDVYADKIGAPLVDDELGEAGEWGQELEDYVARRWAERNGLRVEKIGLLANVDHDFMLASLDRRVIGGCDLGKCGAEIKTRSAWVAAQWDDGIPESVDVQVQYQLAVSGFDHMHVAVLLGGQRMVEHLVEPNPARIERLALAAEVVWQSVLNELPPVIDPELMTVDLLNRVYPDRSGAKVLNGSIARQMLTEYQDASEGEKAFKDTKERIKVELLALLEGGEEAVDENGTALFSYRAQTSRSTDLKRLEADWPDVYAAVVAEKSSRTFRPAKGATA